MHNARALSVVGLLAFSAGVAVAQSGPQGAEVVRGSAQIDRSGATTVIRASDRAIINYRSFDVASGELVRFVQPGANARVLNRITGGAPTRIDGTIQANGRVYFVNRAGIAFGAGSVVDAGRFYAIAGAITDRDFVRGVDRFTLTGDVTNEGSISAKDGVMLAGQTVTNTGTITSVDASAIMVAGGQVLVREGEGRTYVSVADAGASSPAARRVSLGGGDMLGARLFAGQETSQWSSADSTTFGVTSSGAVAARQVHLESTGKTQLSGIIDTSSTTGAGGDVRVLGGDVHVSGDIDARGATASGEVLVGGDWQGKGEIRRASSTTVTSDATINSSGMGNGNAGTTVVWADGHTSFAGTILAQGGEKGGDGAWVEVSGKDTLDYRGFVNASASKGESGTLLLDPREIFIADGGSSVLGSVGFNDDVGVNRAIDADAITAITNAGTNVILQANTSISVEENIITNNPNGDGGDITLQSGGLMAMFNASIVTDGGDLTLRANDASANAGDRDPFAEGRILMSNSAIDAGGGNVSLDVGVFANPADPSVNGGMSLGAIIANRLSLNGGNQITQSGALTVNELLVQTSGPVTLARADNFINRIAADTTDSLSLGGTGAVELAPIGGVNVLRSTGAITLDFGTITQSHPIFAPSLVATARSGGVLLTNLSNEVASFDLRSRIGTTTNVGSSTLSFTNNGNSSVAGISTTGTSNILIQGQLTQSGPINADVFNFTSRSNGTPVHQLLDTSNQIRELAFNGRNGIGNQVGVADLNLAEADGLIIKGIETAGGVRVATPGNVTQGGGTSVIAAGFGFTSTNGSLTLTSPTNNFYDFAASGQNVNVFSTNSINVNQVLGQSGINATGFARLVSPQSILQSEPIAADHLIARTLADSTVANITLDDLNDVNLLTLETMNAGNTTPSSNNIRFRDDDGFTILRLRSAGSARLQSDGVVNQTNANEGVRLGGSLALTGTSGQWTLLDARNAVSTLAGDAFSINLNTTTGMEFGSGLDGASGVTTTGVNNFLRVVSADAITQSQRVQGDQLILRVISDADSSITLENTNNQFARLTLESRTTSGSAGAAPISYRDIDGFSLIRITTASDASFHAEGAVNQTGANQGVIASGLRLTGAIGNWLLDRADNSFGHLAANLNGNLNLTNSRDLEIASINGTNGVSVGSGHFLRIVNAGNITQSQPVSGDLLVARTLSDTFTQALFNNPNNNFNSITLFSNNAANNALGPGRLVYRDADGFSINGAQTTEQVILQSGAAVNQLNATQGIVALGGMRFFGTGGYVLTFGGNTIPVVAGNAANVLLNTSGNLRIGQLGATSGLVSSGSVTLTALGTITQDRPLIATGTLTATTRTASGGGDVLLNLNDNRAGTLQLLGYGLSGSTPVASNLAFASGQGYVVQAVRTTGLLSLGTGGNVTQSGSFISASSLLLTGTGSFTLTNAANSFSTIAGSVGNVNVRTDGPLHIGQLGSTDGLIATGNVTLTAGGAITQSRRLRGVNLLATTRNDTGANITLTGPNNFFSGTRTLRTRNAGDSADVEATATYLQ